MNLTSTHQNSSMHDPGNVYKATWMSTNKIARRKLKHHYNFIDKLMQTRQKL